MRRNEVEDGVVAHPSKSVSNEFVKLLITGVVVGGCVHVAILGAGVGGAGQGPTGAAENGLPPESMVVPAASSTMYHETSPGHELAPGLTRENSMQVNPAGMQSAAVPLPPLLRVPVASATVPLGSTQVHTLPLQPSP